MSQPDQNDHTPYDAKSITVLEGLNAVRERPGMYIGDTGFYGLHHLLMEIINNSVDEYLAGYCSLIEVTFHDDGSVSIIDDGRGIPVDIHEEYSIKYKKEVSAIELVLGHLHAGGKFGNKAYRVAGGLHGVGAACVNALSELFDVKVFKKEHCYEISYTKGVIKNKLTVSPNTYAAREHGTMVTFIPDKSIFSILDFDLDYICIKLKEIAVLSKGLKIIVNDLRNDPAFNIDFFYPGGISSYLCEIIPDRIIDPIFFEAEKDSAEGLLKIEIGFLWAESEQEKVYSYVNNITTPMGGGHVSGFYYSLTRIMNMYIKSSGLLKGNYSKINITGEDVREGLKAIISLKISNPQFEGQTKQRLSNSYVAPFVQQLLNDNLIAYLDKNRSIAIKATQRILLAAQARIVSKRARETVQRKNPLETARLPGKLIDCTTNSSEFSEIYIVEGNSAGGSAKMGRQREFQAVLPVRGKILNVEKATLDRVLQNDGIKSIVASLGCGIGDSFCLEKLRYNKVIIMTDADVDGSHIMTLLVTFFHKFMPILIKEGHLYLAKPPLYKLVHGKNTSYVDDEIDLAKKLWDMSLYKLTIHKITNIAYNSILEPTQNKLLDAIFSLYSLLKRVVHNGVSLEEFIQLYNTNHVMPRFVARHNEQRHILYDSTDVLNMAKENNLEVDGRLYDLIDHTISRIVTKNISIVSLFEENVDNELAMLEKHGLDLNCFRKQTYPILEVSTTDTMEHTDIYSLLELIEYVKNITKGKIDLYRYKGLGEMNDHELGDTTMNPVTRVLIKVCCDDEEVYYVRQLLMGEEVEPRKKFISEYALSISQLDI